MSYVEQDIWERKYHLALERMERDERGFRDVEDILRRVVSRVVALARGQGGHVDQLLDRLVEQLRDAPSAEALEPLLVQLTDAVALLEAVERPSAALPAADRPAPMDDTRDLPDAFDTGGADVAGTAATHESDTVTALRADVAKLQGLLSEVSGRLGDMTRYLASELDAAAQPGDAGRALGDQVREEMRLLSEQTQSATDVASLREQVTSRLGMIDQHFRDYREREDARLASYRERAERMRDRVEELETQATTLQDSLRREHELALTDQLTGLPNRLAYERRVAEVETQVREGLATACLGAFDIDHFKTINDTFGHAAGDAVLRIIGKVLAKELDGRAFVARYGGEEFVVLFVGMNSDEAMAVAQGLCATVEALAFHASGKPVRVTLSGGVTRFGTDERAVTAFDRADRAMYAAKRAGRNGCVVL